MVTFIHRWDDFTFDAIDWDSHGSALRALPSEDQVRVIKFLHKWLPTEKRNHRHKQSSSPMCPICKTAVEEQDHVISCPHHHHRFNLRLQLQQAKSFLKSYQVCAKIWTVVNAHVLHQFGGGPTPSYDIDDDPLGVALRVAIDLQNQIGWDNFMRGRIAQAWGDVQEQFYSEYYSFHDDEDRPKYHSRQAFMTRFIRSIFRMFLGIWKQRNAILHDTISGTKAEETLRTLRRVYKFSHHYFHVDDLFLLDTVPLENLDRLSSYAASQWLSTLTIAIKARHKDDATSRMSQDPSYSIEGYFTRTSQTQTQSQPRSRSGFAFPRAGIG